MNESESNIKHLKYAKSQDAIFVYVTTLRISVRAISIFTSINKLRININIVDTKD